MEYKDGKWACLEGAELGYCGDGKLPGADRTLPECEGDAKPCADGYEVKDG